MVKLSVIVPVYNTEQYLNECLKSIEEQTFISNMEVIIINDGSTDNSLEIIKEYCDKNKNFKFYTTKNKGTGAARNYGLKKSKGKYIGFVDSDDYIEKTMFEDMYNFIKLNNLDILECQMNYLWHNIKLPYPQKKYSIFTLKTKPEGYIYTEANICKVYKKEIIKDIFFPEGVWYEDLAFTKLAMLNANKIGFLKKRLYNYRARKGSTMNQSVKLNSKNSDILLTLDYMNKKTIPSKLKKHKDEIVANNILNILLIIMRTPMRSKINKKEKKQIINLYLNYLDITFPNWENNKYFKKGLKHTIPTNFLFKLCLLHLDKKYRKCKTLDEIIKEIKKILKDTL